MGGFSTQRRRGASAYNPSIGADVVVEVKLSREQARDGARVAVKYPRYESCDNCHGSGSVASEHHRACPTCGGTGSIAVDLGMFGMGQARMVCPECGGSGKVVADPCPVCGGEGRTRVQGEAVVEFPAGTHDGDLVRMKGRGNAGTNGGETGDLVGRAHVSAERLEGRARSGFYTLGLVTPFLVLSSFSGTFSMFLLLCAIPLVMGLVITNGGETGDLVGRAHVSAERLEGRARSGFYTLGLVTPFLVLSSFSGTFSMFLLLCAIPLVMGLVMVLSDDVFHRSGLWWKRGLQVFASGVSNGLLFALISVWFSSCTQAMFLGPYRYM